MSFEDNKTTNLVEPLSIHSTEPISGVTYPVNLSEFSNWDKSVKRILKGKLYKLFDQGDYQGFIAYKGGSSELWRDACNAGILPLSAPSIPNSSIEKSMIADSLKYTQYEVKTYVDIKHRDRHTWNLVGNGDSYPTIYNADGSVLREGCGFLYKNEGLGCLNVDQHEHGLAKIKLIAYKCMRPQCPVDYEFWAAREASRIEVRFMRIPKLKGEKHCAESKTKLGKPIHVVVSVPEFEAELMDLVELRYKKVNQHAVTKQFVKVNMYKKMKKKAAKIAKLAGFRGGCMIFHPFANDYITEEADGTLPEIKVDPYSGNFDYKALKAYFASKQAQIAQKGLVSVENELKLWYIRPHFHLIGYGWIENVEALYAKYGYVVKNLGVRDSVFMTALYQLSHAGYREGQHTVSWIGCMSNNQYVKLDPEPEPEREDPVCPECGEVLMPVRWVGEGPNVLDEVTEEGMYSTPVEGWEYIEPTWVVNSWLPEGGYWKSNYRGRIVKPTEAERERRKRIKWGASK